MSLFVTVIADYSVSTLISIAAGQKGKFADILLEQVKHLRKELENDPELVGPATRGESGGGGGGGGWGGGPNGGAMPPRSPPVNGTVYRLPYIHYFD